MLNYLYVNTIDSLLDTYWYVIFIIFIYSIPKIPFILMSVGAFYIKSPINDQMIEEKYQYHLNALDIFEVIQKNFTSTK